MPSVSVLMAHHGPVMYVSDALSSLGEQSFRDFELVLVDDASGLDWDALVPRARCGSVKLLRNDQRLGLTRSLARGLGECKAPLVARMDSDDLSGPERLAAQVRVLRERPDIDVLGTAIVLIDRNGAPMWRSYPLTDDADLRPSLLVHNQLCHGSIMMRRTFLERAGGYPDVPFAQDYGLWLEAVRMGARLACLPEPHYHLRLHDHSISTASAGRQSAMVRRLQAGVSDELRSAALEAFFTAGRDRSCERPFERLQLGRLALLIPVLASRPGSPAWIRMRALGLLSRHGVRGIQLVWREGALHRQLRLKLELASAGLLEWIKWRERAR